MKLMKDITIEFLEKKNSASFNEIWEYIKKELESEWESTYNEKLDDILKLKIGELYLMLTSQGEFIRKSDSTWSLAKFYSHEDLQKMKINVIAEQED